MALDMATDAAAGATQSTAEWRSTLWAKTEAWLEAAESAELVCTTTYSDMTLKDEWELFWSNVECPDWEDYRASAIAAYYDGLQGAQSVLYWMWLSVQPWLYGAYYILSRMAHAIFGNFLPYIQRWFVAGVRMHMHFSWQQWLAELAVVASICGLVWLYRYVKRQKYYQRMQQRVDRYRKWIRTQQRKATKVAQNTFREIAQVSLLFAMTIPHAFFMGVAIGIKLLFPSWVSYLCKDTSLPSVLSWWYPLLATVDFLWHTLPRLAKESSEATGESPTKGKTGSPKTKAGTPSKNKKAKKKTDGRRRSSGIGLLVGRDASNEYTEEELQVNLVYWLNVWTLHGIMQMVYQFTLRIPFVSSLAVRPSVDSALCQLYMLFFLWIFCLPKFFEVFYPSAAASSETGGGWSEAKKWCYECAVQPSNAIPKLFGSVFVPVYDSISGLIPTEAWEKHVVNRIEPVIGPLVYIKLLKPETKDSYLRFLKLVHTLVPPGILLFTPGFIAQYGVLYVQFIVPIAHSIRAAESKSRRRKALYLQYWVLNCIVEAAIRHFAQRFFWWFPLLTHATFIVWAALNFPENLKWCYRHFERELIQLHLLAKREQDEDVEVDIHQTMTMRAASLVLRSLPSANSNDVDDNDESESVTGDKSQSAAGKNTVSAEQKAATNIPSSSKPSSVEGHSQTVSTASVTDGDENVPPSRVASTRPRKVAASK